MAFLQLISDNPNLSYIIRKNPASGMVVRPVKQGRLFGYYSEDNTVFNCYFKDSDSEISYKKFRDDDWNYVNPTQYNAAEFVLDTINEFFSSAIKKENEGDTDQYNTVIHINMMACKKKYLEIFEKYFRSDVILSYQEICPGNFKIVMTGKKSIKSLLSFAQLFAMFNVLKTRRLDDAEINKYIGQLANIKAPFFIKYVFKVNILRDRQTFNQHKKALEANSFENIEFDFGFASQQRISAVEKHLGFNRAIVDFGCGEGNFVKRFCERLGDKKYYAVDKDPEMRDAVLRRFGQAKNLSIGSIFPHLYEDVDVIMSEVIEHMDKSTASQCIRDLMLLGGDHLKKMIITTPNKDFNQFYFFEDEEMRHDDHHFEMTYAEFESWIDKVKGFKNSTIFGIGDKVNGIPCTLGAVLE